MPTLRDVARNAGTSKATVSRYVNAPDTVSQETRERIEIAIRHLGWVPHAAARALATQRTGTIGAIIPTLANEHFATAIQVLQDRLEARGYTLLLACSEYEQDREYRQLSKMIERGVDAVALVGEAHHAEAYPLLDMRGVPFVNMFTWRADAPTPCVGSDNYEAFSRLTTYLIDLGHRHFGMLAQNADTNDRAAARLSGVRDALAQHRIAIRPDHLVQGYWGVGAGRALFRQVMSSPEPPTALICGNGSFSIGAMLEAQAMGIAVPRDLTIFGFDDFELMRELAIPLSTASVPAGSIGEQAADYLVAALRGESPEFPAASPSELILRASSAPPAKSV